MRAKSAAHSDKLGKIENRWSPSRTQSLASGELNSVFFLSGARIYLSGPGVFLSNQTLGVTGSLWQCQLSTAPIKKRMQSLVLLDGIKGWATAGEEYVQWMDEYDQAVWHQSKS